MEKRKSEKKPEKKPEKKAKVLIAELEELYLRSGTELRERGLYYRVLADISKLDGHVDKDTSLVARIKDIILELKKIV